MDNLQSVLLQMEQAGLSLRAKDQAKFPVLDKRTTCGPQGKHWYKFYVFRPNAGGSYLVGNFGCYKVDTCEKIEVNWKPLGDAERARMAAERAAAKAGADAARQAEADMAAMGAAELWGYGLRTGSSYYLARKGVVGECCRYLNDGSIVVPLIRYDQPREVALRGLQRIWPDGTKRFTPGFAKAAAAVRLGDVLPGHVVLVCEGYVTGLTLRMATAQQLPVYVALDAGNLQHVVPLVRELHPESRILICADDDHLTRDQTTRQLNNPGKTAAKRAAKACTHTDFLCPVFDPATRQPKDTDFNDLHARQGLEAVRRQIASVVQAMRSKYG